MATYNNGNSSNTYYVPNGVEKIRIRVWGAGGGDSDDSKSDENDFPGASGGNGGYAKTELSVSSGDAFDVYVGNGGGTGTSDYLGPGYGGSGGASPLGNGAGGGNTPKTDYAQAEEGATGGGGGGGLTAVKRGNGNRVIEAAGGGGAGGASAVAGYDQGGGGGGGGAGGAGGGSGGTGDNAGEDYDASGYGGGGTSTSASGQNIGGNGGNGADPWNGGNPGGNGGAHVYQGSSTYTNGGGGNSGAGKVIIDEGPSAPTNFSAVADGTNVNLSWNDASYENGYYVYRSTTSGFSPSSSNRIASLGSNNTSYTDSNATTGIKHYYKIRTYNGIGSNQSTEKSAVPAFLFSIYQNSQWVNGVVYFYNGTDWVSPTNIQTYQSGSWQDY